MDIIKTISKNTAYLIGGDILRKILSIVVTIVFVRYLGKTELGKYNIAMAYIFFFAALPLLSHEVILGREMSVSGKKEAGEWLGAGILVRFVLSLAAMILSLIVLLFANYTTEIKILILIAAVGMLASFRALFVAVFQRAMEMKEFTMLNIVVSFLSAFATLLVVILQGSVFHFLLLNVAVGFLTAFLFMYYSRLRVPIKLSWNQSKVSLILRHSFPVAMSNLCDRVMARMDQIFLFSMIGVASVGLYGATITIVEAMIFIPTAFLTVMLPVFSSVYTESEEKHLKSVKLSAKYLLLISLPAALGFCFFAEPIIVLLFGNNYLGAETILKVLCWSMPLNFILILFRQALVSSKKQNLILWAAFIGAMTNIALNLYLIPIYAAPGAALATTVSYTIPIGFFLIKSESRRMMAAAIEGMTPLIPAAVVMGIGLWLFPWHWILNLILGCGVFLLVLILSGGLDRSDWNLLKRAFKVQREK